MTVVFLSAHQVATGETAQNLATVSATRTILVSSVTGPSVPMSASTATVLHLITANVSLGTQGIDVKLRCVYHQI